MSDGQRDLERGAARDATWSIGQSVIGGILVTGSLAFGVRHAGEVAFGSYSAITAIFGLAGIIEGAALLSIARAVAKDQPHDDRVSDLHATKAMLLASCALLAVVGLVVAQVLPAQLDLDAAMTSDSRVVVALIALSTALTLYAALSAGIARGRRMFALLAVGSVAGEACRLAWILASGEHMGLIGLGLSHLAGAAVTAGMVMVRVTPHRKLGRTRITRESTRRLTAFIGPLIILNLDVELSRAADPVIIASRQGAEATSLFRIGATLPTRLAVLIRKALDVIYPLLVASPTESEQRDLMHTATRVASYVGGVIAALTIVLRQDLVEVLLGHRNNDAAIVLAYSALASGLDVCVHPGVLRLVAAGAQNRLARWAPFELVANVGMTWVLVGHLGLAGAGIATLLTFVMIDLVIFPIVYRQYTNTREALLLVTDMVTSMALGGACAVALAAPTALAMSPGPTRIIVVGLIGSIVPAAVSWAWIVRYRRGV